MDMKRGASGFTLVEIMFSVTILGILAALGSYAIMTSVKKANIRQAEAERDMISASVLQLAWDTGRWPNKAVRTKPGSTEIWNISGDAVGLMGTDGAYPDWKGPYYEGEILDPWGTPYFFDPDYRTNGVMRISVGSLGPDGAGKNVYETGTGKDNIVILLDD